ncbi:MAG: CoA transferase [Acidimicrobiales bacterium]
MVSFARTPSIVGRSPAPALGEHNNEALRQRRLQPATAAAYASALPPHALHGVTVIEAAGNYAAPIGASLLADLGARVIKIEPLEGDASRTNGAITLATQGKESLALDLKTDIGRQVLHDLVSRADIFVHNFRPGVPDRLGFTYERLCKFNPRIVYLYASGYGSTGPAALRPGYALTFGAICGSALYQAGAGMPPTADADMNLDRIKEISLRLAKANDGAPDVSSGLVDGVAMMMGLYGRERWGEGQYIETTMLCSTAYSASIDFIRFPDKSAVAVPDEALLGISALYRLYEAQDGWIFLACLTDAEWTGLLIGVDHEQLASDARFATARSRAEFDEDLGALLVSLFRLRVADEWESDLTRLGVACVAADRWRSHEFFNRHPQIDANEFAAEVEHDDFGMYRRYAPQVHLSKTPGLARPASRLGQHTRQLLEELGHSASRVDELRSLGIVGSPD